MRHGYKPYEVDDELIEADHYEPRMIGRRTPWAFIHGAGPERSRRAVLQIHQIAYPALVVGGVSIPIREN